MDRDGGPYLGSIDASLVCLSKLALTKRGMTENCLDPSGAIPPTPQITPCGNCRAHRDGLGNVVPGSCERRRRRRRDGSGNRQRGDGRQRRRGNEGNDQPELKGIRSRFVSKEELAQAFAYHSISLVSVPVPALRQLASDLKPLFVGSVFPCFLLLATFCGILVPFRQHMCKL